MFNDFDVIIIGGGAAGLSGALVLARARRRVLVIDAGSPRNLPATHMHGFLSRDGFPPPELLTIGRAEVQGYGTQIWTGTARTARQHDRGFEVELTDHRTASARRLLVTTGLRDQLPPVPGLDQRWARDVLHCPYCHGYEVRDQRLGVLGGSPGSARYAQIVRQWSDDVVYFAPPATLTDLEREQLLARAIGVVEGLVSGLITAEDRLSAVTLVDGREVPRDALFVPPRFVPNSAVLSDLGCVVGHDGFVQTERDGRTSVTGLWAAGNIADPRAQVISAAGQGSSAAISINADLVDEDVRVALRALDPVRRG